MPFPEWLERQPAEIKQQLTEAFGSPEGFWEWTQNKLASMGWVN
jgi:hypothetical protein